MTAGVVVGHVCFQEAAKLISTADVLKGFGCRQAYESLSCRNPRAAEIAYGDLGLGVCQRLSRTSS